MKSTKTIALIVFAVLAVGGATAVARFQGQSQKKVDEHKRVVEAIRRGGYREAAKIKGHYVGTVNPNWDWSSFDLETLTKSSAAVIVGMPLQSKGQLSSSGDVITTEYDVAVKDVIKGNLIVSSIIQVALLGGKVDFDDGTSAEVETPGFERLAEGKQYVLFLYANRNGSNVFLVTGGPQGVFELTTTQKIKPHARETDTVTNETKGKSTESFLKEIRTYSEKWPEAQGCCD